jgi:D-arabinose 1-dehydrogenase-like Zn-dependent alcohol dehydrogenase
VQNEEELLMLDLRYSKPEEFSVVTVPLPKLRDNDVLIKVKACGVCGEFDLIVAKQQ